MGPGGGGGGALYTRTSSNISTRVNEKGPKQKHHTNIARDLLLYINQLSRLDQVYRGRGGGERKKKGGGGGGGEKKEEANIRTLRFDPVREGKASSTSAVPGAPFPSWAHINPPACHNQHPIRLYVTVIHQHPALTECPTKFATRPFRTARPQAQHGLQKFATTSPSVPLASCPSLRHPLRPLGKARRKRGWSANALASAINSQEPRLRDRVKDCDPPPPHPPHFFSAVFFFLPPPPPPSFFSPSFFQFFRVNICVDWPAPACLSRFQCARQAQRSLHTLKIPSSTLPLFRFSRIGLTRLFA